MRAFLKIGTKLINIDQIIDVNIGTKKSVVTTTQRVEGENFQYIFEDAENEIVKTVFEGTDGLLRWIE